MKITRGVLIRCFALIVLFFGAAPIWAATITWTNISGGDWFGVNNWSPNQLPGAEDTALINTPGTYIVVVNQNADVASLIVGGAAGLQTLQVVDVTFTATNAAIDGTLTVTNSALNGAITVNSGGVINESGGTLASPGSLTVEGGGVLNVAGRFAVEAPLTNAGTINLTNSQLALYNNNTATYQGGLVNQGQINFYGTSGDQINSEYGNEVITNQGTVNQETGTGTSVIYAYFGALSGTYNAALGTTIQFNCGTATAPLAVGTPPVLNGPGQYEFVAGYLLLNVEPIPNLTLTGGTLELGSTFEASGAITNLTLDGMALVAGNYQVNGTLTVTNSTLNGAFTVNSGGVINEYGGTLASTGSLMVEGGGSLNVAGRFAVEAPLTNAGTINLTNSELALYNNNTPTYQGGLVNQGQINFYGTSGDQINSEYGYEYIINQGTISQRPGTGSSSINTPLFTDPGTLDSQEATLTLNTVSLQSSSVLNFGLNSATDYGKIAFTTNVILGGAVSANLNNGFVPATGDVFNVLTYKAFSGIFSQTNFPADTVGQCDYGTTVFSLSLTPTGTQPNRPVLNIERVSATIVAISWPTAAGNFNLQTSPALSPGNWSDITSGITTVGANYTLNYTVSGEAAFFRLQSQ